MCLCLSFSDVKHNLKALLVLQLQTDGLLQLCYGADVESGGSQSQKQCDLPFDPQTLGAARGAALTSHKCPCVTLTPHHVE